MFYLKATEELSPQSWACVLDEGFTCVCPVTPFRHFPPSEVRASHHVTSRVRVFCFVAIDRRAIHR